MADKCTPEEFKLIFEDNRIGAKIFDELVLRFGRRPSKGSGIDRVLDQAEYNGRREVIEFITLRINQANGVNDGDSSFEIPPAE